ncbi:MAG: HPr family phosphocarrier protein [candidate division Zixibacteria bacterium]|nr:HPr family phosphocarrier protein [candidate division Zixibacteria bacterium]
MVRKTVKITNKLGLHARPSAKVVQTATKFKSEITLEKEGLEVNGKSIMGVMMLAAEMGSDVTVTAQGEDAEDAVRALSEVLASKFD